MMGVFWMTDALVSSLPSCGEGGQLLRKGSPGRSRGLYAPHTDLNAFMY